MYKYKYKGKDSGKVLKSLGHPWCVGAPWETQNPQPVDTKMGGRGAFPFLLTQKREFFFKNASAKSFH